MIGDGPCGGEEGGVGGGASGDAAALEGRHQARMEERGR